jgi:hypothetical protein
MKGEIMYVPKRKILMFMFLLSMACLSGCDGKQDNQPPRQPDNNQLPQGTVYGSGVTQQCANGSTTFDPNNGIGFVVVSVDPSSNCPVMVPFGQGGTVVDPGNSYLKVFTQQNEGNPRSVNCQGESGSCKYFIDSGNITVGTAAPFIAIINGTVNGACRNANAILEVMQASYLLTVHSSGDCGVDVKVRNGGNLTPVRGMTNFQGRRSRNIPIAGDAKIEITCQDTNNRNCQFTYRLTKRRT